MGIKQSIVVPVILVVAVAGVTGCDRGEEIISTKLEQAKMAQEHLSALAAACNGTLSASTELTGDIEKPAITRVSCNQMDKGSSFFAPMTTDEEKELEKRIRLINHVRK